MPTILEMALLSMDVYEKRSGGLNQSEGIGQFAMGLPSPGSNGFFAQAYTFSGGTVIAFRGTDGNYWDDIVSGWSGGVLGSSSPRSPQ